MPVDRTELQYLIALTMVPAIGPVTARKLIKEVGRSKVLKESGRSYRATSMSLLCWDRQSKNWNS